MHYIFGILQPLQINHVCDNFRPHGNPLHRATSNKFNPILMMQWIASIWAPVLSFLSLHNRARHLRSLPHEYASSPAEPLQLRSCNTRKLYIKEIPGNWNDVMYCIALHQINSRQCFDACYVFWPSGTFIAGRAWQHQHHVSLLETEQIRTVGASLAQRKKLSCNSFLPSARSTSLPKWIYQTSGAQQTRCVERIQLVYIIHGWVHNREEQFLSAL